ncbi:hypothetical protein [Streptomyces sp. VRA16 Mangrove soil]|uniref:hypothetical protein n=1 Tax=Streptomyces sp. VRA16 Mangrove soil TaxID=2817434 RepID=UPI001A9E9397|nr:hypothetical protein [Streptomyces sp. VRA16 Mangrove soil]MBO1332883.1 hypothetical protein [Streptomyces sp. VRA16 Mangrove soil]
MVINAQGDNQAQPAEPGTALLLAAAPAGKGCLIDAPAVLPALAAVPPSALTGTAAATVVELADPVDPQAVLTRIRTAAALPGPLYVYVTGQLHLDPRQRLLHLALARTTPSTLRYTALPWHWLTGELALRRPHTTTVVLDLVADPSAWQHVRAGGVGLGHGIRLFGRVAPPPPRRTVLTSAYLKTYADVWRTGARPELPHLHETAVKHSAPVDALYLAMDTTFGAGAGAGAGAGTGTATPAPVPAARPAAPAPPAAGPPLSIPPIPPVPAAPPAAAPVEDPHPAMLAAAQAGRHDEAAAIAQHWERTALRAHGAGSPQAIHWLEVRADLARLAQDPSRSCTLWTEVARARLARGESATDEDVEAAVDRAHHQWEQLADPAAARAHAAALTALRRQVEGRRPGALEAIRRRLEALGAASAAG